LRPAAANAVEERRDRAFRPTIARPRRGRDGWRHDASTFRYFDTPIHLHGTNAMTVNPSTPEANPLRALLAARGQRLPVGTWIMSASPIVSEAVGTMGFDWGVLDMEHTPIDL
jgi:hypothetical protein